MRQRPLHFFVHRASIRANFMAFEPLMSMLLNFKGFITNYKLKSYFYLYFGCGIDIGHTSLYLKIGCLFCFVLFCFVLIGRLCFMASRSTM